MNPFDELGIPWNASIDVAKAAYRKLASMHHPDKGGDTERFKNIQTAWDRIEQGYKAEPPQSTEPPPKSSFSDGYDPRTRRPTAGKPAPGYEARRTVPPMPRTTSRKVKYGAEHDLVIELTQDQAFEGCHVPFVHKGRIFSYEVRPGASERNETYTFPYDEMIGQSSSHISVNVQLKILNLRSGPEEHTRDAEMDLTVSALGLFIGGRVTVADHLGEKIVITIPPGYNPAEHIEIKGHGYGLPEKRGKLIVKITPIFKAPADLSPNERVQLQRLNDMVKV